MKYYRVRSDFDGVQVLKMGRKGLKIDRELIANELYTPAELKRLTYGATFRGVKDDAIIFDPVEISRKQTYWFFGARFA